jgi:WD40 repeat protein
MRRLLPAALLLTMCSALVADEPAAKDAHGDALPAGAVARLGTVRLRHPSTMVTVLAFAPDGKTIASAGNGPFVVVWNTETGSEVRRFTFGDKAVKAVHYSPDGKYLVASGTGRVTLWPADGGKPVLDVATDDADIAGLRGGRFPHVAFADGGKELVAVATTGGKNFTPMTITVRRWTCATGAELEARKTAATVSLYLTPDGKRFYGTDNTKTYELTVADGTETDAPKELPREFLPHIRGSSADGQIFSMVGFPPPDRPREQVAFLWDVKAAKAFTPRIYDYFLSAAHAGVSPDGNWLIAAGWVGPDSKGGKMRVDVFKRGAFKAESSFYVNRDRGGEGRVNALAVSADSKWLALATGNGIDLHDLATGKPKEVPGAGAPMRPAHDVGFSPDGKTAATLSYEGKATLWDAETGKFVKTVGDRATCFAFSSDGKLLATADAFGRDTQGDVRAPRVWEIESGKSKLSIPGFRDRFGFIRFAQNDKTLVGTMGWRFTGAFDATSGKLKWNRSSDVSFGGIGKPLYDGFGGTWTVRDGVLSHWSALTGNAVATVGLPRADVDGVYQIAHNGKTMVIVDLTRNCFRVWDAERKEWAHPVLPAFAGFVMGPPDISDKYQEPTTGPLFKLTDDGKYLLTAQRRGRAPSPPNKGAPNVLTPEDTANTDVRVWDLSTGREVARVPLGWLQLEAFDLSANGTRLITGHYNAAPLVWDLSKFAKPAPLPAVELKADELERRWLELIDHNPIEANRAAWALARAGAPAAKLIADKLTAKPLALPTANELADWVRDLDADDKDQRWRAFLELANRLPGDKEGTIGRAVFGKLKTAPGRDLSFKLSKQSSLTDKALLRRDARAVEVLELMNTADALAALKKLGESDAPTAASAKAAAARLEKRLP